MDPSVQTPLEQWDTKDDSIQALSSRIRTAERRRMWRNAPAIAAIFLLCCPHKSRPAIAADASVLPTNVWPQQKDTLPNSREIQSNPHLDRPQNENSQNPSQFQTRANYYDLPPLTKVQQVSPETDGIQYFQRAFDPQVRQIQNSQTTQNQMTNDGKVTVGNGNYSSIPIYASIHEEIPHQTPFVQIPWDGIFRPTNSQRFIQNIPPLPKTNEGTYSLISDHDSLINAGVGSSILPWSSVREHHQYPARYSNSKPNINYRSNTAGQGTEMGISFPRNNLGMLNTFNGAERSLQTGLEVPRSQNLFSSETGIEPLSVIYQPLGTPTVNTVSQRSSNSLHSETRQQGDRTNQDVHSMSIQSPETLIVRDNIIYTDIPQLELPPLALFNYKQTQNNYNGLGKLDEQNLGTNDQMGEGLEYFNRNSQSPLNRAPMTSSLPVLKAYNFGFPNNEVNHIPHPPVFFNTGIPIFTSDQAAEQSGPTVSSSINLFNLENGVQERGLSSQKLHENGMQIFQDKRIWRIPSLPIHEKQHVDRLSQVPHIPINEDLQTHFTQQIPFDQNHEYGGQILTDSQTKDNQFTNHAFIGQYPISTQNVYEINPDGAWQITGGLAAGEGKAGERSYPTGKMNEYGKLTEPRTSPVLINPIVPNDVNDKYYRDNINKQNSGSTYLGENDEKKAFQVLPIYSIAGNRQLGVPQSPHDWIDRSQNPYNPESRNILYLSGFLSTTPSTLPIPVVEKNVKHIEAAHEQRDNFEGLINLENQRYSSFDDHSMFSGGYLNDMNPFLGLQNKQKNPGQLLVSISNNLPSDIGNTDSKSGMLYNSYDMRSGANEPAIEESFESKKNEGKLLYQDTNQGPSYSMLKTGTGDDSANQMSESSAPRWSSDKTFYQLPPSQLHNNPLPKPDESVINTYHDASRMMVQYQGRENDKYYIMPNNSDENDQRTSDMHNEDRRYNSSSIINNTTDAYQTTRNELGRNNNNEETSQYQEHKNSFFKSPGLQISGTPTQSINMGQFYWIPSNINGENKNQYTVIVQYPEQEHTSADLEQLNGDMLLNEPDDVAQDRSEQRGENPSLSEQPNNMKQLTPSSTAGSHVTYFLPSAVKSEFQYEMNGTTVPGEYESAVNFMSESQNEEKSQVQKQSIPPSQISNTNREENAKQDVMVELGGHRSNTPKSTNKVEFYSEKENPNAKSYATTVLANPDSIYTLPKTDGVTASEFDGYQRLPSKYTTMTKFDTERTYYDQDNVPLISDKLHPIEISKPIDQNQSNQQSTGINPSSSILNRSSTHLFAGTRSIDRAPHLSNKDTTTLYDEYQGFPPKTINEELNKEVSHLPVEQDHGELTSSRNALTNLNDEVYMKENTEQHKHEEQSLKSKDEKLSRPYSTINLEKVNEHPQAANNEFDERVGITTFENEYKVVATFPSVDRQQESSTSNTQENEVLFNQKQKENSEDILQQLQLPKPKTTARNQKLTESPVTNDGHEGTTEVWNYMSKYASGKNDTDQSKEKEPNSKQSVTESYSTLTNQIRNKYTVTVRLPKPTRARHSTEPDLPYLEKKFAKPENDDQRIHEETSMTQPEDAKSSRPYAANGSDRVDVVLVDQTNTESTQSRVEGFSVPSADIGDDKILDVVNKNKPHIISSINQFDIATEEQLEKAQSSIINDTIHITPSNSVTGNQSQPLDEEFERLYATTHYGQIEALSQVTREGSSPGSSEHEQQEFIDKYKLSQKSAGSDYSLINNEEIHDNFTDQLNRSSFSKPQTPENVYTSTSLPGADGFSKASHYEDTTKQNKMNPYYEAQKYLSTSPAELNLAVSSFPSPLKIEGSRDIVEQNDKVLDSKTSKSPSMMSSFTKNDSPTDSQNVVYQNILTSGSNMTNLNNDNESILSNTDRTIAINKYMTDKYAQYSATPHDYTDAYLEGNTDQSQKKEQILEQPISDSDSTYRFNPTDSSKSTKVVSYPAKINFSEGYEKLVGKKDVSLNIPGVAQSKFYYGTNVDYVTEKLGQYEQSLERIYNNKEDGSAPKSEHSSLREMEHQKNTHEHKVPLQISDGWGPTENINNSELSLTDRISLTENKDTTTRYQTKQYDGTMHQENTRIPVGNEYEILTEPSPAPEIGSSETYGEDRLRQNEPLFIQTSDKQSGQSSLSSSKGSNFMLQGVNNEPVTDAVNINRGQYKPPTETERFSQKPYEETTQYQTNQYGGTTHPENTRSPIGNDYDILTGKSSITDVYVKYGDDQSQQKDNQFGLSSLSTTGGNAMLYSAHNEQVKDGQSVDHGQYKPSSKTNKFFQTDTTTQYQAHPYNGAAQQEYNETSEGNDYDILKETSPTPDIDSYVKYGEDRSKQKANIPLEHTSSFSLAGTDSQLGVANMELLKDGITINSSQYNTPSETERFSQTANEETPTQYQPKQNDGARYQESTRTPLGNEYQILTETTSTSEIDSHVKHGDDQSKQKMPFLKQPSDRQSGMSPLSASDGTDSQLQGVNNKSIKDGTTINHEQYETSLYTDRSPQTDFEDTTTKQQTELYSGITQQENTGTPIGNNYGVLTEDKKTAQNESGTSPTPPNYMNPNLDQHHTIDGEQRIRLQQQVENQAPLSVMGSNPFYFQQTERSLAHSDHPDLFDSSRSQSQNDGKLEPSPPDTIITSSNSRIDRLENTDREGDTISSLSTERERPGSFSLITHSQRETYRPAMENSEGNDYEILTETSPTPDTDSYVKYGEDRSKQKANITLEHTSSFSSAGTDSQLGAANMELVKDGITINSSQYNTPSETERFSQTANEETPTQYQPKQNDGARYQESTRTPIGNEYQILTETTSTSEIDSHVKHGDDQSKQKMPFLKQPSDRQSGMSPLSASGGTATQLQSVNNKSMKDGTTINHDQYETSLHTDRLPQTDFEDTTTKHQTELYSGITQQENTGTPIGNNYGVLTEDKKTAQNESGTSPTPPNYWNPNLDQHHTIDGEQRIRLQQQVENQAPLSVMGSNPLYFQQTERSLAHSDHPDHFDSSRSQSQNDGKLEPSPPDTIITSSNSRIDRLENTDREGDTLSSLSTERERPGSFSLITHSQRETYRPVMETSEGNDYEILKETSPTPEIDSYVKYGEDRSKQKANITLEHTSSFNSAGTDSQLGAANMSLLKDGITINSSQYNTPSETERHSQTANEETPTQYQPKQNDGARYQESTRTPIGNEYQILTETTSTSEIDSHVKHGDDQSKQKMPFLKQPSDRQSGMSPLSASGGTDSQLQSVNNKSMKDGTTINHDQYETSLYTDRSPQTDFEDTTTKQQTELYSGITQQENTGTPIGNNYGVLTEDKKTAQNESGTSPTPPNYRNPNLDQNHTIDGEQRIRLQQQVENQAPLSVMGSNPLYFQQTERSLAHSDHPDLFDSSRSQSQNDGKLEPSPPDTIITSSNSRIDRLENTDREGDTISSLSTERERPGSFSLITHSQRETFRPVMENSEGNDYEILTETSPTPDIDSYVKYGEDRSKQKANITLEHTSSFNSAGTDSQLGAANMELLKDGITINSSQYNTPSETERFSQTANEGTPTRYQQKQNDGARYQESTRTPIGNEYQILTETTSTSEIDSHVNHGDDQSKQTMPFLKQPSDRQSGMSPLSASDGTDSQLQGVNNKSIKDGTTINHDQYETSLYTDRSPQTDFEDTTTKQQTELYSGITQQENTGTPIGNNYGVLTEDKKTAQNESGTSPTPPKYRNPNLDQHHTIDGEQRIRLQQQVENQAPLSVMGSNPLYFQQTERSLAHSDHPDLFDSSRSQSQNDGKLEPSPPDTIITSSNSRIDRLENTDREGDTISSLSTERERPGSFSLITHSQRETFRPVMENSEGNDYEILTETSPTPDIDSYVKYGEDRSKQKANITLEHTSSFSSAGTDSQLGVANMELLKDGITINSSQYNTPSETERLSQTANEETPTQYQPKQNDGARYQESTRTPIGNGYQILTETTSTSEIDSHVNHGDDQSKQKMPFLKQPSNRQSGISPLSASGGTDSQLQSVNNKSMKDGTTINHDQYETSLYTDRSPQTDFEDTTTKQQTELYSGITQQENTGTPIGNNYGDFTDDKKTAQNESGTSPTPPNYRNPNLDQHHTIDGEQRIRLQQQVENQSPLSVMGSNPFYFQQTERSSADSDHPDLFDSSRSQSQNDGKLEPSPPDTIITSSNSRIDRLENTDREGDTLSSLSTERERPGSFSLITHSQRETYRPVMDTLDKIRNEDQMTNNAKTDGEDAIYMAAPALQTTPSSILDLLVAAQIRAQKGNDYGVTEDSMAVEATEGNDFNNSKDTHVENLETTEKQKVNYGHLIGMTGENERKETNQTSSTADITMTQSGWKKNKNSASFADAGRQSEKPIWHQINEYEQLGSSTVAQNVSIASKGVKDRNYDNVSGQNLNEQERIDTNNPDGNVESIHKDLSAAQSGYTASLHSSDQETLGNQTKSADITLTQTGWMHRPNSLSKLATDEQTANRIHSDQAQEPKVESLTEVSDSRSPNRTTFEHQQYLYYQTNSEKGAHQVETDSMESSPLFRPDSSVILLEQNDNKGLQSTTTHEFSVQRTTDEGLDLNSSIQNISKLEPSSILPVEPSVSVTIKNSEIDAGIGNNSTIPKITSSINLSHTEQALGTKEKMLSLHNLNSIDAHSGQRIVGEEPEDETNSQIKAPIHDESKLKLSSDTSEEPLMSSGVLPREPVIRFGETNPLSSSSSSSVRPPIGLSYDTQTGHQTITEPPNNHTKNEEVREGFPPDGGSKAAVVIKTVDSPTDEMNIISSSRPSNKGTVQSSEDILEQNEKDVSPQTTIYSGQNTLRGDTVKNADLPATYSLSQNEDNANSTSTTLTETLTSSIVSDKETESRVDETIPKEFIPVHIHQSTEPPSQDNDDVLVTSGKAPHNSVEFNSGSGNRSGETIPGQYRFPSTLQPVISVHNKEPSETVNNDLFSTIDALSGLPILGKSMEESKNISMKYPSKENDESRPSIVIPEGTSPSSVLLYGETMTNESSSASTLQSARFADNTELNVNLHGDLTSKTYTVPSTIEDRTNEEIAQPIKSSSQDTSQPASVLDKTPNGISVGYNNGLESRSEETIPEQSSFPSTIQPVTSTDSKDRYEKLLNYSSSIAYQYSAQRTAVEDTTEYTNLPMEFPNQENHGLKSTVISDESLASELTMATAAVPPYNSIVPNSGPGSRPKETTPNEPSSSSLQPVESVESMEQKGEVLSKPFTEDTVESILPPLESSSQTKDEPKLPTVIYSQPSTSSAVHNTESKSRPTKINSYVDQSSLTEENGKHINLPIIPPNQSEETWKVPSEVTSEPQYNSIELNSESGSRPEETSQKALSSSSTSQYEESEGILEQSKKVLGAPLTNSNPHSGQPTISEKTGEASNQTLKQPSQNLNTFYPQPFTIDGQDREYAKSLKTLQNINAGNFKLFTAEYFIKLIQQCNCSSLKFLIPILQKPDSGILVTS